MACESRYSRVPTSHGWAAQHASCSNHHHLEHARSCEDIEFMCGQDHAGCAPRGQMRESSIGDAKRSAVNSHGRNHSAHPIAQCVNLMEEVANDQNQRPKRARQMAFRSIWHGSHGLHTPIGQADSIDTMNMFELEKHAPPMMAAEVTMGSLDDFGKPYDLDHQLATCIQEFEEDRAEYWRQRTDGADWQERLFGHAERVATMLLTGADDLMRREANSDEGEQFATEQRRYLEEITREIEYLMQIAVPTLPDPQHHAAIREAISHLALDVRPDEGTLLKVVWDRLCIHVAEDCVERVVRGANRILQLSQLFLSSTPSGATVRFLRRVSRCFVWGFDAECIILCRGAIDSAFREAVSDAMCDKHGLERAKFGHTLSNRIKAALRDGMINDESKNAAFRVVSPATTAAHENPQAAKDVLAIVRDTRNVLERLQQ
jgi:hypothetical protein